MVEASDTTAAWDRDVKTALYGAAGIPETWVVDLNNNSVHVFTEPGREGYAVVRQAMAGDVIASGVLGGLAVAVAEILGPA